VLSRRLRHHLVELINGVVTRVVIRAQPDDPSGGPVDMLAAGIAGATLGMIGTWVTQEEPAPVNTAAEWIWTMLGPHRHTPIRS